MKLPREIIRMEQIVAYSQHTRVLDFASFSLLEKESVGILGLNHAGKTFLMKALAGIVPIQKGTLLFHGQKVSLSSPQEARGYGIFYIQPFKSLMDNFSIAENIYLGTHLYNQKLIVPKKELYRTTEALLQHFHLPFTPNTLVKDLDYTAKLFVEMLKAVVRCAKVIILDSVLHNISTKNYPQVYTFFQTIKQEGTSLVFVETRLQVLKPFTERIFIIRDGRTVGVEKTKNIEETKVIKLMSGSDFISLPPRQSYPEQKPAGVLLQLEDIYYHNILCQLNFQLYKEEFLGILNVNRRSGEAIEELLLGLGQPERGAIVWKGQPIHLSSPAETLKNNIAIVKEQDIFLPFLPLKDNILLPALKKNSLGSILDSSELKYLLTETASQWLPFETSRLQLTDWVPSSWLLRKRTSLCRALVSLPELLVLSSPTQRIDFLTRQTLYKDLLALKKSKLSALIISGNIHELIALCDRIVVVQEGVAVETFPVLENTLHQIMSKYSSYLRDV